VGVNRITQETSLDMVITPLHIAKNILSHKQGKVNRLFGHSVVLKSRYSLEKYLRKGGQPMIGFEDKKYPSVMVQGVLLATNVLYLQQTGPNIHYYFPINGFTRKMTYHVDTYILYGMTVLALFFMVLGLSQSIGIATATTLAIALSPLIWKQYGRLWVRDSLTKRLSRELHQFSAACPSCGGELQIKREVLDWDKGREYRTCLGECDREDKEIVTINIG
jgi:hypothetical protein